jgi:hypothetical protein
MGRFGPPIGMKICTIDLGAKRLSADLEDSSRGRYLCGTWTCSLSDRIEEKAAEARYTTQKTRIPGTTHLLHIRNQRRVIFEGVAGVGG